MFKLKSKKWLTFPRILVLLLLALVVFLFTVLYYGTVSEEVDLLSDDTHRLPVRRKRYLDDNDLINSPDIESYSDLKAHVRDKRDKMRLDELEREYSLCKKMIPKEDKGCMKTFLKMYKLAKEISEKMDSMKKMFHDSEILMKHDSSDTSYEKYAELIEKEKVISSSSTTPSTSTIIKGDLSPSPAVTEGSSSAHQSPSIANITYESTTVETNTSSSNPDIIRGVPSTEKLEVKYGGCKSKSKKTNHTDMNVGTLIFGRTSDEEVDECEDLDESIENLVDSKEHLSPAKYTTTTRSIKPNDTKHSEENSSEEHHSTTVESIATTTLTTFHSSTEKVYNISESTTMVTNVSNTTQEYSSTADILATNMTTETTPYESSTFIHSGFTESVVTEKTTETATNITTSEYDSLDISTKGYHLQSTHNPSTTEMKPITEFLGTTEFKSDSTTDFPSTTEMRHPLITEFASTTDSSSTREMNRLPTTDSSSTREMKEATTTYSSSTTKMDEAPTTHSSPTTEIKESITTDSTSTTEMKEPTTTDSISTTKMDEAPTTDSSSTTEMKEPQTAHSTSTTEMKEPPSTESASSPNPVSTDSSSTTINPFKPRNLDEEKLQEVLSWKKRFEEVSAKHNQELEELLSQMEPGVLDKAGLKINRVNTELIGEFLFIVIRRCL